MPLFRISVINSDFRARSDHELPDFEAARAEAITGAIRMGLDRVVGGEPFFGAEVLVDRDGEALKRFVVSIGASLLS